MPDNSRSVLDDLITEGELVDSWVRNLDEQGWLRPTPAARWTIKHQIAHLAWTDEVALVAATDPFAFRRVIEAAMIDPTGHIDHGANEGAALLGESLLHRWREGRRRLNETLSVLPLGTKIPWFGPSVSGTTLAMARLMETWAHGHDIAEALGIPVQPTSRLRHIAALAVQTRDFSYHVRGLAPPEIEFRFEVRGPRGELWTWGPEESPERITGTAEGIALLATRRRHPADVEVSAEGMDARRWLTIAQAFAGPSGDDPGPVQRALTRG